MRRPDWVDEELYPFDDHWVRVRGAQVHYVDEGAGTPILMVHGNPTWSFLYRRVIRELAGELRCIAVDLPGFGLSTAPSGYRFTAAEHAEVLAGVIDRLGLDDYLLMGQDWGGPIGLAAARPRPERVAGLVLANTFAWSMGGRPLAHLWALGIGGVPGRYLVERLNGFAEIALRFGARRNRPSGRVLDHYTKPFPTAASRKPTWVLAREVTAAGRFLEEEAHSALRALADRPALLPWGDRDPVFSLADRDRLAAELERPVLHTLHGAGHFVQEDAPRELAAAIRSWWA